MVVIPWVNLRVLLEEETWFIGPSEERVGKTHKMARSVRPPEPPA
jgi:hypothetical protein